ncbi:sugar ABC transporter permease [Cellulomonas sp. NPDC089187]|uniref:carbohydrate ABC transporter permease n=1 Tax=Cellulomonas sp. NPDC089187 TaxID=3154970 RepID=UPI00343A0DAD
MTSILTLLAAVIGIPLILVVYLLGAERLIRRLPPRRRRTARAYTWLAPAGVMATLMLIYPLIETIRLSLMSKDGSRFVGWDNYVALFQDNGTLIALRNNLLWLVFFTVFVTVLGLVVAVLADGVRGEKFVRSVVVLPTAISFVGAGVIWGLMYEYRAPGQTQTGTLNAAVTALFPNADPIAWLTDERTNNAALIFIGIWMSTGFAAVILSAAIKGVPTETIEAAQIDGANSRSLFFRILLPQISGSVAVVVTLMAINALKVFDVIYVLTNGNYNTQVLATQMYAKLFAAQDPATASAVAVVLLAATVPLIVFNVRNARKEEQR